MQQMPEIAATLESFYVISPSENKSGKTVKSTTEVFDWTYHYYHITYHYYHTMLQFK